MKFSLISSITLTAICCLYQGMGLLGTAQVSAQALTGQTKHIWAFTSTLKKEGSFSWEKVSVVDAYQSNARLACDSTQRCTITFRHSGQFYQDHNLKRETGSWQMDRETGDLVMTFLSQQGQRAAPQSFDFQLIRMTADELVLGQPGRHGMVRTYYKRVSLPNHHRLSSR
ncbi:MAG: hypothetical protein AAFR61_25610 [Bacteroidota bacterium]